MQTASYQYAVDALRRGRSIGDIREWYELGLITTQEWEAAEQAAARMQADGKIDS